MAPTRRIRRVLKKKARNNEKDLIDVAALICKLMDGDKEKAKDWIYAPNSFFFDASPLELILVGKGKVVIEFLKERLGDDNADKDAEGPE